VNGLAQGKTAAGGKREKIPHFSIAVTKSGVDDLKKCVAFFTA
jgi:hypothetical protein